MERLSDNKFVLVTRKTRLEDLIIRFNTISQAKFYVEHLGADFSDYSLENDNYKQAVRHTHEQLQQFGRVQVVDRAFLPNFIFGKDDIVVAVGQDGLVANILKYLDQQPLVGINPDPARWDGVLLPFISSDITLIAPEILGNKRKIKEVTMAKVSLNNGQHLYGVNDIFLGPKSHTSIRYQITHKGKMEFHSSSGIVVSTGLGSTGWLKSLMAGATAIAQSGISQSKTSRPQKTANTPWDASHLIFTVREPFPSKTSEATLVFGQIKSDSPLRLVSNMPENGVIFSDGIEADYLEFNSGVEAVVSVADKRGHLVV